MKFTIHSPTRATLEVGAQSGSINFESDRYTHRLVVGDATLFEFEQPRSPDDAWTVARAGGAPLSETGPIDADITAWLPSECAAEASALISALPAASYELAVTRPTLVSTTVLLGNENVEGAPESGSLHRGDHYVASVLGAQDGEEPDVGQPMVALTIINLTGQPFPIGMMFANLQAPRRDRGADDRSVLIIAKDGPLVVDNMARFSPEESERELGQWRDVHAAKAADELAISDE